MKLFVKILIPVFLGITLQGGVWFEGKSLVDSRGLFLGLGATYFQALGDSIKGDNEILLHNLKYLNSRGVNYIRVVAMLKDNGSGDWPQSREIDPFGEKYWNSFRSLLDDSWAHGLKVQITIFTSTASIKKLDSMDEQKIFINKIFNKLLNTRDSSGVPRFKKVLMLEVANEWFHETQNLTGKQLKGLTAFIRSKFKDLGFQLPLASTSPEFKTLKGINEVYDSSSNMVTFHFSRNRKKMDGWNPVVDCEDIYNILAKSKVGVVPVSSNEPIGPGSSIMEESRPDRIVMAAAYAWSMGLPMYVYHSAAGVGMDLKDPRKFDDKSMPGLKALGKLKELLPGDFVNGINYKAFNLDAGTFHRIRGRKRGNTVWTLIPGASGIKLKASEKLLDIEVYDPWTMDLILKRERIAEGGILDLSEWLGESLIVKGKLKQS